MISYMILSSCFLPIDIVHDMIKQHDIIYDIIVHFIISYMISCFVIIKTVSWQILAQYFYDLVMISCQYHKKTFIISLTSDFKSYL